MTWPRRVVAANLVLLLLTHATPARADELAQPVDYTAIVRLVAADQAAMAGDRGAAEALVRLTFPEDPDRAVRIAQRESGLRCGADNPRSSAAGIMQLMSIHAARARRLGLDWRQVQTSCLANLTVARQLYDEQGWRPWAL